MQLVERQGERLFVHFGREGNLHTEESGINDLEGGVDDRNRKSARRQSVSEKDKKEKKIETHSHRTHRHGQVISNVEIRSGRDDFLHQDFNRRLGVEGRLHAHAERGVAQRVERVGGALR